MQIRALTALLSALLLLGTACSPPSGPVWYGDIDRLVQRNCVGCHTAGGVGPVALDSYEQARAVAPLIAAEVEAGTMPPWQPDPDCHRYDDERLLTAEQKQRVLDWVAAGAPEGDPARAASAVPAYTLDRVDAVLDPGHDYTPEDRGLLDDHRCFILDPEIPEGELRYVTGFRTVPGVARMVHHVLYTAGDREEAQALDDADPGPGWECEGRPGLGLSDFLGTMGVWVPGTPAVTYPRDTGFTLTSNEVVIAEMHYNFAAGPPAADRSLMELRYAELPVTPMLMMPLPHTGIRIPPGAEGHRETMSIRVSEFIDSFDATLHGVFPHMHQLGRSIGLSLGEGADERCMVDIPDWDFYWQQSYFFPDGTSEILDIDQPMNLTCTFDNPTDETVRWGENTGDEMCVAYLYMTLR